MTDFATLFDDQPTKEALTVAFDAIEADITYIDDYDVIRYYSPFRIFSRPQSCLNTNVYDCHPEHTHQPVREMLDAFRAGTSDTVSHESLTDTAASRPVRICYHAMRNKSGAYLGCLEVVTYQD